MSCSPCILYSNLDLRKGCLISGIITMFFNIVGLVFMTYKMVKLETLSEDYKEKHSGDEADYEEVMASVFLLIVIATVVASLSVIKGAAYKARKNLVAWLLIIIPVCIYGSVLVTFDCAIYGLNTENAVELGVWIFVVVIELGCFRAVLRYYRKLAADDGHPITRQNRFLSAVFTITGSGTETQTVAVTLTPPSYDEVDAEGPPKYTVTPEGRLVPISGGEKPPDYTP